MIQVKQYNMTLTSQVQIKSIFLVALLLATDQPLDCACHSLV